jgi:cytochrome d ubiquinol oxidase subunit I
MVDDVDFWSRLQFGFTITYHYLFPQLTMGLAPFLVFWRWMALRTGQEGYLAAARFWGAIFGLNFVVGVVTGIPMEFQFGTNWSSFSRYAGGVVGQTLAMEGMFAFFLESAFIGAMVFGERLFSRRAHLAITTAVFLGSWLSGYFILVTNAFMQHPLGFSTAADGTLHVASFSAYLLNPWALVMFCHNMTAAVVTGAFVISAVGAFYALRGVHEAQSRLFLTWGTAIGLAASVLVAFPTGDAQAKEVARYQEVALAAMEGRFDSGGMAEMNIIGQPDVEHRRIDNPVYLPGALSYLATGTFQGRVQGLDAFPQDQWPTNVELLYYAYHIMVGLGTLFILVMALAVLQRLRGRLQGSRRLLWILLLSWPFPYIATTAGWMTAELGRQPWLVYGLFRTRQGHSPLVHSGTVLFTLIGFGGLYFIVGVLYLVLVGRLILQGPRAVTPPEAPAPAGAGHG